MSGSEWLTTFVTEWLSSLPNTNVWFWHFLQLWNSASIFLVSVWNGEFISAGAAAWFSLAHPHSQLLLAGTSAWSIASPYVNLVGITLPPAWPAPRPRTCLTSVCYELSLPSHPQISLTHMPTGGAAQPRSSPIQPTPSPGSCMFWQTLWHCLMWLAPSPGIQQWYCSLAQLDCTHPGLLHVDATA